jgi:tetratricopeptide (TPR) repeat protein
MDNSFERKMIINELNSKENHYLMETKLECITKNVKKSCIERKNGNTAYTRNNLVGKAFKYYTKSIALAPHNSTELAIAYGNRAHMLYCSNKYEESISDINKALRINTIDILYKLKILCRKVQNLAAINSPNIKIVYDEFESLLPEIDIKDSNKYAKKAKDVLNNISKVNYEKINEIPEYVQILSTKEDQSPFDTIEVKSNKEFDRYVVSTRDIKSGEIIFVEKACLKFLEQDNFLNYCGHCFSKSWTNIPCDYCNWCMFCSEECKQLAWMNYHNIECITISQLLFHDYKIDNSDFLSLRSLLMKINELGGIANFKADNLQFVDEFIGNKLIFPFLIN